MNTFTHTIFLETYIHPIWLFDFLNKCSLFSTAFSRYMYITHCMPVYIYVHRYINSHTHIYIHTSHKFVWSKIDIFLIQLKSKVICLSHSQAQVVRV